MDKGRVDPHMVLGVPTGAAWAVVRRAYRRRVRQTHPDLGGSAADFHRVQQAWEALSGPRRDADSQGDAGEWSGPQEPPGSASEPGWTLRPPGGQWPVVSVTPGRHSWLGRLVYVLAALLVTVTGVWLARPEPDQDGLFGVTFPGPGPGPLWALAWVVTVVVVGFSLVRGAVSGGVIALGLLALVAIGEIGSWWWWGLAGCTVASLLLPVIHLLRFRPMWSVRRALDDGPVFGSADRRHQDTAALVEQLTVIPAVRVFHQAHGAAHVVVCGGQVAAVGAPPGWEFPGVPTARVWPLTVVEDPVDSLDDMAAWLLSAGGTTVDRRVLADLTS